MTKVANYDYYLDSLDICITEYIGSLSDPENIHMHIHIFTKLGQNQPSIFRKLVLFDHFLDRTSKEY